MNIQELIKAVIIDGEKLSNFELTNQDLEEIQLLIKSMRSNLEKAKFIDPKRQVVKGEEVLKIDDKGQWSIEKTIKPGPTINYSRDVNPIKTKEQRADDEASATTINYSDPKNVTIKKPWSGKAAQASKIREKAMRTMNETAVETFARRNKGKV